MDDILLIAVYLLGGCVLLILHRNLAAFVVFASAMGIGLTVGYYDVIGGDIACILVLALGIMQFQALRNVQNGEHSKQ
jgi:hypothetical protein